MIYHLISPPMYSMAPLQYGFLEAGVVSVDDVDVVKVHDVDNCIIKK